MGQSKINTKVAIVVAVGPGPREVERLHDLVDSIAAHEPLGVLVLVDDHPQARHLDRGLSAPRTLQVVSLHHTRPASIYYRRGKGICSAIMTGLKWAQANTDAAFALKLDTDSLVIGGYRQAIGERFAADPRLGMIGAYELEAHGEVRDWTIHHRALDELTRRLVWRRPRHTLRTWNAPLKRRARRLLSEARERGYRPGEHCLGGGYAVSRRFLDAAADAGLMNDPMLWCAADLPEDVMVGLHVRALGFEFADMVDRGDVFGVRYIGLAFPPAELLARGHAIIHAVKNDPDLDEDEIRAFFREHRLMGGPRAA